MTQQTSAPLSYQITDTIGFITLERPQSLNALNLPMIDSLHKILDAWRFDETVHAVIVQGKGERAFCAGGDLRTVYEAQQRHDAQFHDDLFRREYTLNLKIADFPKPYISFIHGFAMGGGLGLSVHGSYRLVAENAQLAMPETKIGYFPDVGASYFLNKAPGALGLYLALTGNTIGASDSLYIGLATHFIPKEKHDKVIEDFLREKVLTKDNIEKNLEKYIEKLPDGPLKVNQEHIDGLFTFPTLEEIFNALEKEPSPFAEETLKILKMRSPTSLRVTFDLFKRNKGKALADAIETEFQLSQIFIKNHDFFEGIRSVLIDKDQNPHWMPESLAEVGPATVESYFTKSVPSLIK